MRMPRCGGTSPSSSARSASSRSTSIFFGEPCGVSRRCGGPRPSLATLRLPSHPRDDFAHVARQLPVDRASLPAGRGEPGRLLPLLAPQRATPARHDGARRHPTSGPGQWPPSWLPPDHLPASAGRLVVNHKRVLRLMRQDNLLCLRKRAFVPPTTDSKHGWPVVPNLAGGMLVSGLDQLWVADITYIRLQEEFAYLAVILDAFSRRVI